MTHPGVAETGDGTAGWNYAFSGAAPLYDPSLTLPVGTDGGYWFTSAGVNFAAANAAIFGWTSALNGAGNYQQLTYAMYGETTLGSGQYVIISNNVAIARNGATLVAANGDVCRTRRVGSTIVCDVSKDNGITWTIIHTFSGVATGKLYPGVTPNGVCQANNFRSQGMT